MQPLSPEELVRALWERFDRFAFDEVGELLHDDFVCEWLQSGERVRGRGNFIAFNKHYPGQWRIRVVDLVSAGDRVVTEIRAEFNGESVTAISFVSIREGRIAYIREYWPEPYEPQAWRLQWVERL